jgi:di/tricarboxylate transporter
LVAADDVSLQCFKLSCLVFVPTPPQVTVPAGSDLIGLPAREANLRQRFDASLVGLQRGHGRLDSQLNDVVFVAGDILLLDVGGIADTSSKEFTSAFEKIHIVKDSQSRLYVTAFRVTVSPC